ncbi:hypothetical protein Vafri_438, partial [Volvox africanus]
LSVSPERRPPAGHAAACSPVVRQLIPSQLPARQCPGEVNTNGRTDGRTEVPSLNLFLVPTPTLTHGSDCLTDVKRQETQPPTCVRNSLPKFLTRHSHSTSAGSVLTQDCCRTLANAPPSPSPSSSSLPPSSSSLSLKPSPPTYTPPPLYDETDRQSC